MLLIALSMIHSAKFNSPGFGFFLTNRYKFFINVKKEVKR